MAESTLVCPHCGYTAHSKSGYTLHTKSCKLKHADQLPPDTPVSDDAASPRLLQNQRVVLISVEFAHLLGKYLVTSEADPLVLSRITEFGNQLLKLR